MHFIKAESDLVEAVFTELFRIAAAPRHYDISYSAAFHQV